MRNSILLIATLAWVATSCSDEFTEGAGQQNGEFQSELKAHVVDFTPITAEHTYDRKNGPRRTKVVIDGSVPKFEWAQNDRLGVYSASGITTKTVKEGTGVYETIPAKEAWDEVINPEYYEGGWDTKKTPDNEGLTAKGYTTGQGGNKKYYVCSESVAKEKGKSWVNITIPKKTNYYEWNEKKTYHEAEIIHHEAVPEHKEEIMREVEKAVATGAGQYTYFDIKGVSSTEDGKQTAVFAQNQVSVKEGEWYFAFSPFMSEATTGTEIRIDYDNQTQSGNATFDHLGAKDYMYSELTKAKTSNADDLTDFQMKHIGAVIRLRLKVPTDGNYTQCQVYGVGFLTGGTFNLATYEFTPDPKPDGIITITLGDGVEDGIRVKAGEYITVYLMVPEQDLTDKEHYIGVKLKNMADHTFETRRLPGLKIIGGHAYGWTGEVYDTGGMDENGNEYVEMGEGDNVIRWASKNVGASEPWEDGDWVAWGEVTPKADYSRATYKWGPHSSSDAFTKYFPQTYRSTGNGTWSGTGDPDDIVKLLPEDDFATQSWGEDWVTPTAAQLQNLASAYTESHTWVWSELQGKPGYYVFDNLTGSYIFLPANGNKQNTGFKSGTENQKGYYWCSELEESLNNVTETGHTTPDGTSATYKRKGYRAYHYGFSSTEHTEAIVPNADSGCNRYDGRAVRPVYKGEGWSKPIEDESPNND